MEFGAQLDGMLAGRVRDVIDKLRNGIRTLELGPLESAEAREEIAAEADTRQAAGERPAHAGIQTVTGRWRVQIARQRRLIQAVVAGPRFVHPARARSPDPASTNHLRPRVNVREPILLQLGKIFHRARVVSEEVSTVDAVTIVQVIVDLSHNIIDMDDVVEPIRNSDGLSRSQACAD